jgi:serine/threonine-protein kinase HipA
MKYEADGGPSLVDMVQILTEASTEPRDPLTLVAIQAFNIAVGNNDGHTKNFSMLREPSVRLAPAYDLVCTRAWPALDKRLGISVGGQRDPGAVGPRAWATFAEAAKLSARAVVRVARELTEKLAEARATIEARVIEQGADETAVRHAMGNISAHITRALKLHDLEKAVPAKKR